MSERSTELNITIHSHSFGDQYGSITLEDFKIEQYSKNRFKIWFTNWTLKDLGMYKALFSNKTDIIYMLIYDVFYPRTVGQVEFAPETKNHLKPIFDDIKYIDGFCTKTPTDVYPVVEDDGTITVMVALADLWLLTTDGIFTDGYYHEYNSNTGSMKFFKRSHKTGERYTKLENCAADDWIESFNSQMNNAANGLVTVLYADNEVSIELVNMTVSDNESDLDDTEEDV